MDTCDFLIVGGGIAGASAGFELAEFGRVLLLERESQFGYHSTGRSAAVFLKSHGPDVIKALASASKQFLLQPPSGFAQYPLLTPRGLLLIGGRDDLALLVAPPGNAVDTSPVFGAWTPTKPDRWSGCCAMTMSAGRCSIPRQWTSTFIRSITAFYAEYGGVVARL
jgi:D-arginine dehydrogenase